MAAVSRTYLLRKTTFFSHVFITVFSFLRISNFFVCIIHVKAYNPFVSAHDETRECIFAAFRMPIHVDIHAFGETVKLGRFIIRFSNIDAAIAKACRRRKAVLSFYSFQHFLHFLHYLTQKRIKNVIPHRRHRCGREPY